MGHEFGVRVIEFTNMSPLFKGISVTIVGILALLFVYLVNKRWKQPIKGGFKVFAFLSVFIFLYGLFILIFQPQWWSLPY
jgi:hypothetical protein